MTTGITHRSTNFRQMGIAVALMAFGGCISVALGQDANWDLKNYHIYNAYALLHSRLGYDIAPAQLQSYYNPFLDVPYFLMAVQFQWAPRIVAFLQGTYFGLAAYFLFRIALIVIRQLTGNGKHSIALALVLGLSGAGLAPQIGTTMNEIQVTAIILLGLWFLLLTREKHSGESKKIHVLVAGLLFGIAAGFKLTAAIYSVSALIALMAVPGTRRSWIGEGTLFCLAVALGFAVVGGPWFIFLVEHFGNPVFPYFNNVFRSEWWEPIGFRDARFFPRDIWQWLIYPFYWARTNSGIVTELEMRDARFAVVFLLLVATGLKKFIMNGMGRSVFQSTPAWSFLLVFWVVAYVAWLRGFSIFRYAATLELLSGILIIGLLSRMVASRRLAGALLLGLSAVLLLTTVYPDWGRVAFDDSLVVKVDAPPMPQRSLVVLATSDPFSYIVPSLPASTRLISINNNFLNPSQKNRLMESARRLLREENAPSFLISAKTDAKKAREVIKAFGFDVIDSCQRLRTNLDPDSLVMCRIEKIGLSQ